MAHSAGGGLAKKQASNEGAGWQPVLEVKATTVHKSRLTPRRAVFGATTCSEVKTETGTSCACFFLSPIFEFSLGRQHHINSAHYRPGLASSAILFQRNRNLINCTSFQQLIFLRRLFLALGNCPCTSVLFNCADKYLPSFRANHRFKTYHGGQDEQHAWTNEQEDVLRFARRL